MEEDKHSLLHPLIPYTSTTTTISSSSYHDYNNNPCINYSSKFFTSNNNNNIIFRILLVLFVASISIWANYEASSTFDITIVNDAKDSLAGKRFALSYVSNDKASRIVLNTSSFVEQFLYPKNDKNIMPYHKKHIQSVTLRLSPHNLSTAATVTAATELGYYVIDISPMLLEGEDYNNLVPVIGAVQRAIARIWLWDGGSRAPRGLVDGMVEYVAELAGFRRERVSSGGSGLPECEGHHRWWWDDKDPRQVASYLHYYEKYKEGFIQRLNQAMRDTWHDRMVDDALGMSSMNLCGLYNDSAGSSISSETRFV